MCVGVDVCEREKVRELLTSNIYSLLHASDKREREKEE